MNRKTGSILKRVLAGSLALTTAFAFGGCGSSDKAKSNGKIAVICKAQGVSFWDYVKMGAEDAGEEIGYDIVYNCASQESSIDEQIGFIKQAIDQDVKAIIVAPNSTTELNTVLKQADQKGIKVVTVNSDVADLDDERLCCISSDNVSCGNIAAREALKKLTGGDSPKAGSIGIVGHGARSSTSLERIKGFQDEFLYRVFVNWRKAMAETEGDATFDALPQSLKDAYDANELPTETVPYAEVRSTLLEGAGMNLLEPVNCDNDRETAKQQAADLIKNNSDLVCLFSTSTNATLGVCDAVKEAGKAGDIIVIGFNSDEAEIEYLKTSVLTGTVVQAPYNMGYLGVRYANRALEDDTVPDQIDTGATYVSMSNIEEPDVKLLLDPRSVL